MQLSKIIPGKWYQTQKGDGPCLSVGNKGAKFELPEGEAWLSAKEVQHEIVKPDGAESIKADVSPMTATDMRNAARFLGESKKGKDAIKHLLPWLDDTGLLLDYYSQEAVLTLLMGAWGQFSMTARDEMREAMEKGRGA